MAFSQLTRALPKVARSGGDDLLRAGTKAVAGSVDDIAGRVKTLIDKGFDPESIIEARKRWEKGDLNFDPGDPRLGSKKNGQLIGDFHAQHASVEQADAMAASQKARDSVLRQDNPILSPDEKLLDEPVAKAHAGKTARKQHEALSDIGRSDVEEKLFNKAKAEGQRGGFAFHHILDLEFTGKLLNRIDAPEIINHLKRFGVEVGDRARNIIGELDYKSADFRLSAREDLGKQIKGFNSWDSAKQKRVLDDLQKVPKDDAANFKELRKGKRDALGNVTEPEVRNRQTEPLGDYISPSDLGDPASYGLPRGAPKGGSGRYGYKMAKEWPAGTTETPWGRKLDPTNMKVTTDDLRAAYKNRYKYHGVDIKKVKYDPSTLVLGTDHVDLIHKVGYNSPNFTLRRNLEAMEASGEWRRLTPAQAASKIAEVYQIQRDIVVNVSKRRLRFVKAHLNKSAQGKLIIRKGPEAIREWMIKNPSTAANIGWYPTGKNMPTFKQLSNPKTAGITEELQIVFAAELQPFQDLATFAEQFTSQL